MKPGEGAWWPMIGLLHWLAGEAPQMLSDVGGQGPGFNPIENTLKLELMYQVEKRGSLIV